MTRATTFCCMSMISGLSAGQFDRGGRVQRDTFGRPRPLDHLQIPSRHFGETLDRIILEIEGDLGELPNVPVARAEHERVDTAMKNGAETHRAGLAGCIERAVRKRAPAELLGGIFDGKGLRMGGGIAGRYF